MPKNERERGWNRAALLSVAACALLLAVGALRLLSYSRDGALGAWLRETPFGYRPEAAWSVRFFKLVATPVVVAGMYFVFRFLNHGHRVQLPGADDSRRRTIDFRSWRLRLVLTSVVTIHWIPLEWMKFTIDGFYPDSPFESVAVNAVVLLASQALAFFAMRYLSFEPLRYTASR